MNIMDINEMNLGDILSFLDMKNHINVSLVNKKFFKISNACLPNILYDDDDWILHLREKEIEDPIIMNEKNIFNWFMITMKYKNEIIPIKIYNKYKKLFNPFLGNNVALYVCHRENYIQLMELLIEDSRIHLKRENIFI
jgi:hypothetical protein